MSPGIHTEDVWIPRQFQLERLPDGRCFCSCRARREKTTYVNRQFEDRVALRFTLLDGGLLTSVLADSSRIRRDVQARGLRDTVICIDEIQKCPEVLSLITCG